MRQRLLVVQHSGVIENVKISGALLALDEPRCLVERRTIGFPSDDLASAKLMPLSHDLASLRLLFLYQIVASNLLADDGRLR
jgi:hypothetical protein